MGYPMCTNIHVKITAEDALYIYDVNAAVLDTFVRESTGKAKVTVLKSPKEITENSAGLSRLTLNDIGQGLTYRP